MAICKTIARLRPTERSADTATPWARRDGWSGEVAPPAVVVGRLRRAADAIVGQRSKWVMYGFCVSYRFSSPDG